MAESELGVLGDFWRALGGDESLLDLVAVARGALVLPAVVDVTGLALACTAAAALATSQLHATRCATRARRVFADSAAACAVFLSERLLRPLGWERPALRDPLTGDYQAADGWVRLDTDYRHHRGAATRVLGIAPAEADRHRVAATVAGWRAHALEEAVIAEGGCAVAMRTRDGWFATAAGRATAQEPPVSLTPVALTAPTRDAPVDFGPGPAPLHGVRVLDLTRVIAGPVCTRHLAAYGADVLRLDPPAFAEVAGLLPDTTAGKRTAFLDLTDATDRGVFEHLVGEAHVLVSSLRGGALARLGYDPAGLRRHNPTLVTATPTAYGWSGPWWQRRGFDRTVQLSTGIAAAGARASGATAPVALPAQALDHAAGHLLAAGVCLALDRLLGHSEVSDVRASLVGVANVLIGHPTTAVGAGPAAAADLAVYATERVETAWGPALRVPLAGRIDGVLPSWTVPAGQLGRHPAAFA